MRTSLALVSLLLLVPACGAGGAKAMKAESPASKADAESAPARTKAPAPTAATVLIKDMPHVAQKPDFCGEACAEMVLRKLGYAMTQDDVFNVSGVDPALGRGCHTAELAAALARIGFKVGPAGEWIDAVKADKDLADQWKALRADLERGIPSIVCMRTAEGAGATEHFRLVLGHDTKTEEIVYHEPAEAGGAYRRMKLATFLPLWPLKYKKDRWFVVRLRMEPGRIVPPARLEGHTPAEFAQHVMRLKARTPAGFAIVVPEGGGPFVVVGDEPPDMVGRRATGTVKWAVVKLKADYFPRDPPDVIDVWLFKDKESYRKHTKELFGDEPDTPFGYFSYQHRALIMNIATGGGTLVHEIVHPYMHANFPECPTWFDEGLASLYEQSSDRGGHIVGLTNWRLKGLQESIEAKKTPSFKDLTATSERQFRAMDSGRNYAQARYLCYYLQEKGLLVKFYRAFLAASKDDPAGYGTLVEVLGEKDMADFQKRWEAWVLKLHFP